jgi:hypothetical protein
MLLPERSCCKRSAEKIKSLEASFASAWEEACERKDPVKTFTTRAVKGIELTSRADRREAEHRETFACAS